MKKGCKGFTLVELIVVIAILGILAGIAVPVYSEYVKRASKAADEQLIGAVNTAAAAAVLEAEHTDIAKLGSLGTNAVKGQTDISVWHSASGDAVSEAFKKYFKGNETSSLKFYGSLAFDPEKHVFKGVEAKLDYDYEWTVPEGLGDKYDGSNWSNDSLSVPGTTGTVDRLTNALANFVEGTAGNARTDVLADADGFQELLKDKFGIDFEDADAETLANATVFYVADKLKDVNASDLQKALLSDKVAALTGQPATNLDTYLKTIGIDDGENHREYQLVTAALKYAIATAYVNSANGDKVVNPDTGETLRERVTNTSVTDYASVITLYSPSPAPPPRRSRPSKSRRRGPGNTA